MRQAGRVTAAVRDAAAATVAPGVTTAEIEMVVRDTLRKHGASASFPQTGSRGGLHLGKRGGHPRRSRQAQAQIRRHRKIDVSRCVGGYHGDTAITVAVGEIPPSLSG